MSQQQPWGEVQLADETPREVVVGALHLRMKRVGGELWICTEREGRSLDDDGEWQRWAVPDGSVVGLRPALPDRLLVVSHELPFHLVGHGDARVYVRIPLFVQVVVTPPGLSDLVVLEEPSVVLSDTWWGTVQEGELAYWLTTKARAAITPDLFVPHMGMCPIRFENRSDESLPVDRFAVRAIHLSLFEHEGRVWTDEVRVRYLAAAEGSEIDFGGRPPAREPDARRLAEPRVKVRKGFQARTFDRLRSLSMLGG